MENQGVAYIDGIVIDEQSFEKASSEFLELGKRVEDLKRDVESMVKVLKAGFDTPAGRKFIKSCEENLYEPFHSQSLIIQHIATTLNEVKNEYSSVFEEYRSLQEEMKK